MTTTHQQIEPGAQSATYQIANKLLGGRTTLRKTIADSQDAHELISIGLPTTSMLRLIANLHTIAQTTVLAVIGISERSFARRKANANVRLPLDESSRLWQFAELLAQACQTLGSQEAAEEWFGRPAIALNGHRPVELLATAPGARLVSELLTRMEYGVYT
ncbi:MAG: antitoxin Xre/MbcA/ParS toxin-binding domain-containing protein [Steroidobacteraceae bacterium]